MCLSAQKLHFILLISFPTLGVFPGVLKLSVGVPCCFCLSPSVWPASVTSEALPQEPKSESETTSCTATTAISDSNVREQIREKISCLLQRARVPMNLPEPPTSSPSSSLPQSSRFQESHSGPFKEGPVKGSVGHFSGSSSTGLGVGPRTWRRMSTGESDNVQCTSVCSESGEISNDSRVQIKSVKRSLLCSLPSVAWLRIGPSQFQLISIIYQCGSDYVIQNMTNLKTVV